MTSKFAKLAAAYRVGFLGDNILETYFSFFANMILERKDIQHIGKKDVRDMFEKRYGLKIPFALVSSVLGVGIKNGSLIQQNNVYDIVGKELAKYRFSEKESGFDEKWKNLTNDFSLFCRRKAVLLPGYGVEEFILQIISHSDDALLNLEIEDTQATDKCEIAWYNFIKDCYKNSPNSFEFISSICASNTLSSALIYYDESQANNEPIYANLSIYLDTPIVLAILGIDDSQEKIDSSKQLLDDLKAAKCTIYMFDHSYSEMCILLNNASIALKKGEIDISKMNNVTRYFQRNMNSSQEIADFIISIGNKLDKLGINILQSGYYSSENAFQEDEVQLFEMIRTEYINQGNIKNHERDGSIQNDVRSISMLYRLRRGINADSIHNARHLFLTYNLTVARVSRDYQHKQRGIPGSIPVCISADLFGTLLWMSSSLNKKQSYQSKKLLSDCFDFLKPRKNILELYRDALYAAKDNGEIDNNRFVYLMEANVAENVLISLYEGDYSLADKNTIVQEVVRELKREAAREEAQEHQKTKDMLKHEKDMNQEKDKEIVKLIETVEAQGKELVKLQEDKSREKRKQEKSTMIFAWVATIVIIMFILVMTFKRMIPVAECIHNVLGFLSINDIELAGISPFFDLLPSSVIFLTKAICENIMLPIMKNAVEKFDSWMGA